MANQMFCFQCEQALGGKMEPNPHLHTRGRPEKNTGLNASCGLWLRKERYAA